VRVSLVDEGSSRLGSGEVDDPVGLSDDLEVVLDPAKKIHTPSRSVRNRLRNWEVLVAKMESGWPPDGIYFPEEYVNELEKRDRLDAIVQDLPEACRQKIRSLLDALDVRFESASLADGGEAVRPWASPQFDYDQLSWWWHRSPANTPWRA
jgi:hypothetical protein